MPNEVHELTDALGHPDFAAQKKAVDKMLYILGAAYVQKRNDFDKLLSIKGPNRKYFAKSQLEIEKSGANPSPRNIPGSPYWVLTKTSTDVKRKLLTEALKALRYSDDAIAAAIATVT
jgi:negative modulator of initiation of replication